MARAMWLGALLLLAACSGAIKTYAPDGKEAYVIQCRGGRYACAEQAGQLCGRRGYTILDQTGQAMPPQRAAIGAPELMIACGDTARSTVYSGASYPPAAPGADAVVSKKPNEPQAPPSDDAAAAKLPNQSK